MLLVKRWLKDSEPDLKLEDLPENDPATMNDLVLQVRQAAHAGTTKCPRGRVSKPGTVGGVVECLSQPPLPSAHGNALFERCNQIL